MSISLLAVLIILSAIASPPYYVKWKFDQEYKYNSGGGTYVVHIDKNGEVYFTSDQEMNPIYSGPARSFQFPRYAGEKVYELRHGRLILGHLGELGSFTPLAGEKIVSLESYLRSYDPKSSPRIYNLSGTIVKRK